MSARSLHLKRRRLDFEDETAKEDELQISTRRIVKKKRRRVGGRKASSSTSPSPASSSSSGSSPSTNCVGDDVNKRTTPFEANYYNSEFAAVLLQEDDDEDINIVDEREHHQDDHQIDRHVETEHDDERDEEEDGEKEEQQEEEEDDDDEQERELTGEHDDFRSLYAEADQRKLAQQAREAAEEAKWRQVVATDSSTAVHSKTKLRGMVMGGVPTKYRASLWRALCYAHPWAAQQRTNEPALYARLLLNKDESKAVEQIRLDLDRTLVDNAIFTAIPDKCDHLFDVLKAYSCLNTSLGYCQGMAPVVGGLMAVLFNDDLLAAEDDRTSTLNELAFWLLAIILDGHGMSRYYEPGMEGLIKDAALFHEVLALHLPELAAHLDRHRLDVLMYMTPWFLSLYTQLPNWELVLAIYDMVFVEGTSALFRFALAILEGCAEELLSRQGIERILPYLLNVPVDKLRTAPVMQRAAALDIDDLLEQAHAKVAAAAAAPPPPTRRATLGGVPSTPQRMAPSTPLRTTAAAGDAPSSSLFQRMFSAFPTPVRSKISLSSPFQPRNNASTASSSTSSSSAIPFLASPFTAPAKRRMTTTAIAGAEAAVAAAAAATTPARHHQKPAQPAGFRPTTPFPASAKLRPAAPHLMPPHQFHRQHHHHRSASEVKASALATTTTSELKSSQAVARGVQTPMPAAMHGQRPRHRQPPARQASSPLRRSTALGSPSSPLAASSSSPSRAAKRRISAAVSSSPSSSSSPSRRSPATKGGRSALRSLISSSASGAFTSPAASPLSPVKDTPSRRPKKIRPKRMSVKRKFDDEDKENSPNIKSGDASDLKSFITPTKLRLVTNNTTPSKRARVEGASPAASSYYFSPSRSPVIAEGAIELKSLHTAKGPAASNKKRLLFVEE